MIGLSLIKQYGAGTFLFDFFPQSVTVTERANWQAQETTIGTKPLFYANRDPAEIRFEELWLDSTYEGTSLTPVLTELRALLDETAQGTPAPLLAAWGDRQERCVLQELVIDEQFYDFRGRPLRAKVRLTLLQLQSERERARVRVLDDTPATGEGPEP